MAIYERGSRSSPDTEPVDALILGFPDSTTVRNDFLWFISHLVYGFLLEQSGRFASLEGDMNGGRRERESSSRDTTGCFPCKLAEGDPWLGSHRLL